MLDYADKLTRTPGAMCEDDVISLRAHGLGDRDNLDVNQVVAYFAYVNRVADGLGVTIDEYAVTEHAVYEHVAIDAGAAADSPASGPLVGTLAKADAPLLT